MTQAYNEFIMTERKFKTNLSRNLSFICYKCGEPVRVGSKAVTKKAVGCNYKIYHGECAEILNII